MKKSVIFFNASALLLALTMGFAGCKQEVDEPAPEYKPYEGTLAAPEVKVESKFGENVITWSVVDHAREFYIYRAEKPVEAVVEETPAEDTPAAQIYAKKNKKDEPAPEEPEPEAPAVEEPVYDWTYLGKSTQTHGGSYYDTVSTTNKLKDGATYIYKVVASGNTARAAKTEEEKTPEIIYVPTEDFYYTDSYGTAEVTVTAGNIPAYMSALPAPEASFTSWTDETGAIRFAANQSTPNDRLLSTSAYAKFTGNIEDFVKVNGGTTNTTWPAGSLYGQAFFEDDIITEFSDDGLTVPGTYTVYVENVPGKYVSTYYATTFEGELSKYYRNSEAVAAAETIVIPHVHDLEVPSLTITDTADTPVTTLTWNDQNLAEGATLVIQRAEYDYDSKYYVSNLTALDLSKASKLTSYNVAGKVYSTYTFEDKDVELGKKYIYFASVVKEGAASNVYAYYIDVVKASAYTTGFTFDLQVSADKKSATGIVNYTINYTNLKSVKVTRAVYNNKTGLGAATELTLDTLEVKEWLGKTYVYIADKNLPKLSYKDGDLYYIYEVTYVTEDSAEYKAHASAFASWNEEYGVATPLTSYALNVTDILDNSASKVFFQIYFDSLSNVDVSKLKVEYLVREVKSTTPTTYLVVGTGVIDTFTADTTSKTAVVSKIFSIPSKNTDYIYEFQAFYDGELAVGQNISFTEKVTE